MTKYATTPIFFLLLFFQCIALGVHAQLSFVCPTGIITSEDTTTNDPALWNNNYWFDALVASHDLADGAQTFAVFVQDSCPSGPTHYRFILYLDLNNDGTTETRVDSDSLPAAGKIHFNNQGLPVFGGEVRSFDFRAVPSSEAYQFEIGVDSVAPGVRQLRLQWRSGNTTIPPQLPYGKHRVQWLAYNACGDNAECTFEANIKDGKAPEITCIAAYLTVNMPNVINSMAIISTSDFIVSVSDNYLPSDKIKVAIRKVGEYDGYGNTTGWPRNAFGNPQALLLLTCWNVGVNEVEIWASDGTNTTYCEGLFIVEPNLACELPLPRQLIAGKATTADSVGILDVTMEFKTQSNGFPLTLELFTNQAGFYLLYNYPPTADCSIKPKLDIDPLNGVNTYDLVLISRNILGLEPLNSPYKLIAADANRSGTVTTFDIVELRKLILGTYQKLPNNTSWRFVDKKQIFPNPQNPFSEVFRDSLFFGGSLDDIHNVDFIGIKVGDVDLTATTDFTNEPVEWRNHPAVSLTVKDQYLEAGEIATLHFQTPDDLAACQLALDLGALELLEIIPENGLTDAHFAHFSDASENTLALASELPRAAFSLRVRAPRAGYASEFLGLNTARTPSVGFDYNGAPAPLNLQVLPNEQQPAFLFQNAPNPWTETTQIGFYLPHSGPTTLRIFDATGQLRHEIHQISPEGYNSYTIQKNELSLPGLYWYSLYYNGQSFARKMMIR